MICIKSRQVLLGGIIAWLQILREAKYINLSLHFLEQALAMTYPFLVGSLSFEHVKVEFGSA